MKKAFKAAIVLTLLFQASLYSLPPRPSILFIGDSNTEKGYLTGALQHFFDTTFGYTGSGYCPFNTTDLTVPYIGFKPFTFVTTYGSTFTECDMYSVVRAFTPPYPSPDGKWIHGSTPGDSVTVRFVGGGIDFYWLSKPNGGTFKALIDGVQKVQVTTSGTISQTNKTSITGLDSSATKSHKLKISVVSGEVTLLGFDVLPDSSGNNKRAVVHNWGNSWCSTVDFVNVDTTVFRTALLKLNPDVVIILLGENDIGDHLDSIAFKNNMTTIAQRVRKALPDVNILLVSSHCYVTRYLTWSYPKAAEETGAKFWDMYSFFKPDSGAATTQDGGGHLNPAGGVLCATELWKQINKDFPTDVRLNNPIPGNSDRIASTRWKSGHYLLNGRKSNLTGFNTAKQMLVDIGSSQNTLHPTFVIVK
jgi:hypothetical protein